MRVKLYKKSPIINNVRLFTVVSVLFLHIITSINVGVSAFSAEHFILFLKSNIALLVLMALVYISVSKALKFSKYLLATFSGVILLMAFQQFFVQLDKILLVLNLFYLIVSYYFYSFLTVELSEAIYVPGFTVDDIGPKSSYDIKVRLFFQNGSDGWGYFTRMDNSCCFIAVEEKLRKCRGVAKMVIQFEGRIFEQAGEVVSSYGQGIGIRFLNDSEQSETIYNWNDFFTVICHRGFLPQYAEGLA